MSNVLIARPTLSDAATLSGDNVNIDYPIENALTQQPREKVRSTATTLGVSIDMNAIPTGIDFIGCLYNNAASDAVWRVRGALTSTAFDSQETSNRLGGTDRDWDFDKWSAGANAIHTKTAATVTEPEHWVLVDDSSAGSGTSAFIALPDNVDFTDNDIYRITFFVKPDQTNYCGIWTTAFSSSGITIFDLSSVAVHSLNANHVSGGVTLHDSGVYECWITFNPGGTASPQDLIGNIRLHLTGTTSSITYDGTNSIKVFSSHIELESSGDAWGYDSFRRLMWNEAAYTAWDRVHSLLLPITAQSYRYWRIDFGNIDSTFEFGRLYLSEKYQPTRNVDIGLKLAHVDASFGVDTAGAHYRRQGRKWREMSMRYSFRYEAEAYDDWVEFDLAVGTGGDCFVSIDPTERIMNRSIYCYPASLGEVDHGVWNVAASSNLHTKGYTFREFEKP